jgi:predicted phosphate transport protein (TIGR00153 family)
VLVFKEGVANYLNDNHTSFENNLQAITKLEGKADALRRWAENELYTHSLMPEFRGDILRLLEKMDDIIDTAKQNLYQFDVEQPKIPKKLNEDLLKLTDISTLAVGELIPAARAFFREPQSIKDKIHRVYFYEQEADQLANSVKKKIYADEKLQLAEKNQLRYFTLHIENISDCAETVADILSILAIKRIV